MAGFFPLSGQRRGAQRKAGLLWLASLCAVVGCKKKKPALEIFPAHVQVDVGSLPASFRVIAHVRGPDGRVQPAEITWSASSDALQPEATGRSIQVAVRPGVTPGTTAELRAQAGSRSATTLVTFVKTAGTNSDRAQAAHIAYPSVAMLSGWSGACVADSIIAFVAGAALGDWRPGSCDGQRAALFSEAREPLLHAAMGWTHPPPPEDVLDASVSLPLNAPVGMSPPGFTPVRLKVWALDGVPAADAMLRAMEARAVAQARLFEARGGIFLELDPAVGTVPFGTDDCRELVPFVAAMPAFADPTALNLYYVPRLIWSRRGKWCGGSPDLSIPLPGNLIMLSTTNYSASTLTHEIGHALGQVRPWRLRGHADQIAGLSTENLMWAGVSDVQASARWHLTVGQVFRMHYDRASWLGARNAGSVPCECNPYKNAVCPRLTADFTRAARLTRRLPGGSCP